LALVWATGMDGMKRARISALAAFVAAAAMMPGHAAGYSVDEKSIAQLQADLAAGRVTSVELVEAYQARIRDLDRAGPKLQSVIAINPDALAEARAADKARGANKARGPLFGIPLLVKDNIESKDPMPTTAGSLALIDNVTHRDAPVVARLRAAGAIILGKTNLSEWANIRSTHSISGWSAVGGLTKNPYSLDRNACGSSAGTGTAVAASLAAAGLGTETDGSVTCPSSIDGIVGIKPTVGLVPRTDIVPISASQDTAGPMGRSVADVAALLTVMAGSDPSDPATGDADKHKVDYAAALRTASLKGVRLGVIHIAGSSDPIDNDVLAAAVAALKKQGAIVVELAPVTVPDKVGNAELHVLLTELKAGLNAYLATTPRTVKTRTLADVIAFDRRTPRELSIFDQDLFDQAEATKGLDDPTYVKDHDGNIAFARKTLDKLMADHHLDALITPTTLPSWRIDVVRGERDAGESASLPAIAGYPHLTVPMGYVKGLPVGISFIGPAWSEARLLQYGYVYEQAAHARVAPKFIPSMETTPAMQNAFAPYK